MSVISKSVLTLGYRTLPFLSAAGWPGSYFSRNSELSVRVLPSSTSFTSSARLGIRARRGRIRVGNVLRDDAHAPGLRAQAGGGDGHGLEEVQGRSPSINSAPLRAAQRRCGQPLP